MSPAIRVDEDVYLALQSRAEPFVDTPNSVLRRLLELEEERSSAISPDEERSQNRTKDSSRKSPQPRARKKKRTRAPSGTLLRQEEYEVPLLETLEELGGGAAAGEVIEKLGQRLNGKLKPSDYASLDSGAVRWHNRAQFVRYELVQRGDMKSDSPRGVWEISDQGRRRLTSEGAA